MKPVKNTFLLLTDQRVKSGEKRNDVALTHDAILSWPKSCAAEIRKIK